MTGVGSPSLRRITLPFLAGLATAAAVACGGGDEAPTEAPAPPPAATESPPATPAQTPQPTTAPPGETGDQQRKYSWVVRRDGHLFCSGWYEHASYTTPPPSRANASAYTIWLVGDALARHERDGADATLEFYNSPRALDGSWYVFVLEDRAGALYSVANANRPELVGTTYERIDANGFDYGAAFTRTVDGGAGRWVSYLSTHPVTREDAPKHTWIVRLGDLLFGAGWYEGIRMGGSSRSRDRQRLSGWWAWRPVFRYEHVRSDGVRVSSDRQDIALFVAVHPRTPRRRRQERLNVVTREYGAVGGPQSARRRVVSIAAHVDGALRQPRSARRRMARGIDGRWPCRLRTFAWRPATESCRPTWPPQARRVVPGQA